jgi:uncharacterized membrane protein YoaK (UPF0700 family)
MMKSTSAASRATVLLFTWAAGSVDAITYLTAHVFTANMTGNAVLLGISVGQGKGAAAVSSLVALLAFVGGVVLGALVVGEGDAASASADVRRAVWFETFLLVIFAVVCLALSLPSRVTVILLIISSGLAMGVQSAAVRRLKLPGIATTYITGTITSLFSGLVHHWRPAPADEGEATRDDAAVGFQKPVDPTRSLALQAEVFFSYTIAALACAALHTRWPYGVALLPLVAIIAVDVSMARHQEATRR